MVITTNDLKDPDKNKSASEEEQLESQDNPLDHPAAGDTEPPRNQSEVEPDADVDWGIEYSPNDDNNE